MDSEYPFVLLGDYFFLATLLEQRVGFGLIWRKSSLHRKLSGIRETTFDDNDPKVIDVSGVNNFKSLKRIHQNLKNIISTAGIDVVFISFDFTGITILTSKSSNYQAHDLVKSSLALTVKRKSRFSIFKNENINYCNKYLPLIPNSLLEQDFHLEILSNIINKIDLGSLSGDKKLFVLSGELVWSGWINSSCLLKLISTKFPWNNYYKFDKSGIWQYLLFGKDPGRYKINKNIFDPEAYCLKLSKGNRDKRLNLDLEGRKKTIYLSGSTDFFDLKENNWNFNTLMLPRYLIVKGIESKNFTQNNCPQGLNLQSIKPVEYCNPHYRIWNLERGSIDYSCDPSQNCTMELQSWVDRNDTLGSYDKAKEEKYEFPSGSHEITVLDGQIIKRGTLIARKKRDGTRIIANLAGKVSIKEKVVDSIRVKMDKKIGLIKAPFPGILLSFSRSSGFKIGTRFLRIPVEYQSDKNFMGRVGIDILIFNNAEELLEKIKQDKSLGRAHGYLGAIIKTGSFRQIAELSSNLNGDLPFVVVNCVSEQLDLELDRFLGRLSEKFISCENGSLKLPWDGVREYFKPGFIKEPETSFRKGNEVKFVNYECISFYGKIEKHLNPVKNINSYLINSRGGFYECSKENILLLDYFYE